MKSSLKIAWKTKITFLLSKIYFILIFFFFFCWADTKKDRYASVKVSNAALAKLTDWIIKNDHVINCAMFFCKWFKHGQTGNVIWLSTTWFLIFQLEVANKKSLFTTNPANVWIEISCWEDINFYSSNLFHIPYPQVATLQRENLVC